MKSSLQVLTILATGFVVLSGTNTFAMGKKATVSLAQIDQKNGVLTLKVQDPIGASAQLDAKKLGCFSLVLGPNLASCLKSCNGKTSVELTGEPNYEDLMAELSVSRFEDKKERSIIPTEPVFFVEKTLTKGWKIKDASKTPDSSPCSPDALKLFDGDQCLMKMEQSLNAEDPIEAYIELLRVNVKLLRDKAPPRTDKLLAKLDQLKALFATKKLEGFLRQGSFVVGNIKNAPVFLCQIFSRSLFDPTTKDKDASFKNRSLRNVIQDNIDEVDASIDFVKRVGNQ
ncbi:hypothetical protein WDW86_17360 [Bdellovibrionota bacterium FG-2]